MQDAEEIKDLLSKAAGPASAAFLLDDASLKAQQKETRTIVEAVGRKVGAKPACVHDGRFRSYCTFNFVGPALRVGVLVHQNIPIIACTHQELTENDVIHSYAECSAIEKAFEVVSEYRPVNLQFLEAQLSLEHWKHLPAQMQSDIKYWRPTTVGEVIFNAWD